MTREERLALKEQLRRHEGLRLKPYKDTVGKTTIGVGRNLDDKGITDVEAMVLLDTDIEECVKDLSTFPWFAGLSPVRQRALLDLRFNIGGGAFRSFKNTLAAIARGDFAAAADGLLASKWATQVQRARVETIVRQVREGV